MKRFNVRVTFKNGSSLSYQNPWGPFDSVDDFVLALYDRYEDSIDKIEISYF